MSTRSNIAIKYKDGKYDSIYCHCDGYPDCTGRILLDFYKDPEKVKKLISLGALSYVEPEVEPEPGQKHDFNNPAPSVTVAYHRDRGNDLLISHLNSLEEVIDCAIHSFADYIYIYDEVAESWSVSMVRIIDFKPLDKILDPSIKYLSEVPNLEGEEEERVKEKNLKYILRANAAPSENIDFATALDKILEANGKEVKSKKLTPELEELGKDEAITFPTFKEKIEYAMREEEFCSKLNDLYREYKDIVGDAEAQFPMAGGQIIEMLEEALRLPIDENGYSTLSWWFYEADCGQDEEILESFELTKIPEDHPYRHPDLSTVDKLYKFIIWERDEVEKLRAATQA